MHRQVLRLGRRVAIAIVGGAVIIAGVILLPAPGPGSAVILLGLGILSLEFQWARVWLARIKTQGSTWLARFRTRGSQLRHRLFRRRSRPGDGQ